jgi:hypothetical protein
MTSHRDAVKPSTAGTSGSRGQWPQRVRDLSEVPEPLRTLFGQALGDERPVYCFLVGGSRPGGSWWTRSIPSQLVACTEDRLLVLRGWEDQGPAEVWQTRLDRLLALEWGQVQRRSWVRFIAAGPSGVSEARVEYNTMGWAYVWQLLAAVVAGHRAIPPHAGRPQGPGSLEMLPAKFRNALRHRLTPWDRLLCLAYQPKELTRSGGLPWAWRVRFPGTVLTVTSHHVLLLEEEGRAMPDETDWGVIATYVPLSCVHRVEIETTVEAARLHLTVGRDRVGWCISVPWSLECLDGLRSAVACVESAIGRAEIQGSSPA